MSNQHEAARHWIVATALAYLGTPYVWGGDDPSGFDCSGLMIELLRSVGLFGDLDLSADGLMSHFSSCAVTEPTGGCLVFILNTQGGAGHVGLCLDRWFMIEAGGGDDRVTDQTTAWRRNAFVKIRPIPLPGPRRRICDPFVASVKE